MVRTLRDIRLLFHHLTEYDVTIVYSANNDATCSTNFAGCWCRSTRQRLPGVGRSITLLTLITLLIGSCGNYLVGIGAVPIFGTNRDRDTVSESICSELTWVPESGAAVCAESVISGSCHDQSDSDYVRDDVIDDVIQQKFSIHRDGNTS